jgi:hypothetical protein
MPRRLPILLMLLTLLAVVPSAQAQSCQAPAGAGSIDEYCETIPGATGNHGAGVGGGGGGASHVSDQTAAALARDGKDGQALARSLGTDPSKAKAKASHGKPGAVHATGTATQDATRVPDTPSANPFTAVSQAIGGSDTIGSPFFLALLGVLLLMLGTAWVSWRRSSS